MTLPTVLITGLIMGMIGLAFVAMFANFNKAATHLSSKTALESLTRTMELLVMNDSVCNGAFRDSSGAGVVFNPATSTTAEVNQIYFGNDVIAEINKNIDAGFQITRLQLVSTGIASDSYTIGAVNYRRHFVRLELDATKTGASVGTNTITQKFYFAALANPTTNRVEKCQPNASVPSTGVIPKKLIIHHENASTYGGQNVQQAWTKRPFNKIVTDEASVASLSNNVITLQPGTYHCHVSSNHYGAGNYSKIRFVLNGSPYAYGLTLKESNWNTNVCTLDTSFTISSPTPAQVEYWSNGQNSESLGNCGGNPNCDMGANNAPYVFAIFSCEVWRA